MPARRKFVAPSPATTAWAKTPDRGKGPLLTVVCAGIFVVYFDGTVVNVALPDIQADLGGGITQLQWVVDIYALAFASLLLTSGIVGDLVGRRRMFLLGLAGFTLASACCALATSIDVLLIARAVQGGAGSGLIPISLALITQLYVDPVKRAKVIGLWAGVGGIALAMGPVLGGVLLEFFSWRSVFWINVPIGIAAVIALNVLLPRTQSTVDGSLDPWGQLLFIASIGLCSFGLIEGNTRGWASTIILAVFSLSALALAWFIWWQRHNPRPLIPIAFFQSPMFVAAFAVNFLGLFGLFIAVFLMNLYLQTINGFSPVQTGLRFLALTASIMVASALAPDLANRFGTRKTIVCGSALTMGGCLGLTQLEVDSNFGSYGWALALLGVGVALSGAPATIAILANAPAGRAGTASGVSNTFRQVGAGFGVALAGAVVLRHLQTSMSPRVEAMPIPDVLKQTVLDAMGRGDLSALGVLPDGLRQASLDQATRELVVGMHAAFAIGAIGAGISGLVAFVFMRAQPRHRLRRITRLRPQDQQLIARRHLRAAPPSQPALTK